MRVGVASTVALALCGCSMVLPGMSLADPETTASITPAGSPLAPAIDDVDWKVASPVLAQALDPLHKGPGASWSNADTGGSGSFTANGQAYVRNDQVCRSFSAAVKTQGREDKLIGVACRLGAGDWTVQKVKPAANAV